MRQNMNQNQGNNNQQNNNNQQQNSNQPGPPGEQYGSCNIWKGPLNTNDKQTILNAHNWYRNQIALQANTIGPRLPFAKNMLQMYWSDALAQKAQDWANNCKFQHSTKEWRRQPDFPTGENIYEHATSGGNQYSDSKSGRYTDWSQSPSTQGNWQIMDWNKSINAWFNEIKDYGGKSVDSLSQGGPVTGHFTQVIWANSYLVGCGFSQHKNAGWFTSMYICHYGPVGNVVGLPVYASSPNRVCVCPEGTSCGNTTYAGLCCVTGSCTWQSQTYTGPIIPGTIPTGLLD